MARLDRVPELEQILPVENVGFYSGLGVLSRPGMVNRINGAYQSAPERVLFWRSEKQCTRLEASRCIRSLPQSAPMVSTTIGRGRFFQHNVTTR